MSQAGAVAIRSYAESLPQDASGWLSALDDPPIGQAIQMMHQDPARQWSLELLARSVAVSRSVLINRFTEHLGVAPMTYLLNWRIQLAAGMLNNAEYSIARVAGEVGYESDAAFSRAFKRCTGVSPGAWRSREKAQVANHCQ